MEVYQGGGNSLALIEEIRRLKQEIENLKGTVLWANPDITQSFAPLELNVPDLSKYTYFDFIFRYVTTNQRQIVVRCHDPNVIQHE